MKFESFIEVSPDNTRWIWKTLIAIEVCDRKIKEIESTIEQNKEKALKKFLGVTIDTYDKWDDYKNLVQQAIHEENIGRLKMSRDMFNAVVCKKIYLSMSDVKLIEQYYNINA